MSKVKELLYTTDMQKAISAAEELANNMDTIDPETGHIKVKPIEGEWRNGFFWDEVYLPSQSL